NVEITLSPLLPDALPFHLHIISEMLRHPPIAEFFEGTLPFAKVVGGLGCFRAWNDSMEERGR
ncbi:unnamed protein product, partial [Dovyalis caffra]